jgi:deoxyribodipyrimidine photo-lyase
MRLVATRGGCDAAHAALERFLDDGLSRYGIDRSHPDDGVASGLSPYLHFGHVSPHAVFDRIVALEGWRPSVLEGRRPNGKRDGWWGMSAPTEAFLEELVTWRELGHNHCARNPTTFDRYESLPAWARRTLEAHAKDRRPNLYSLEELAEARTHDELWNAAQTELTTEGRLQNYLRMLWGKKILEWSPSPREALGRLIELNNRYALDGRDPNSYSGIFWTLGRYDRPWAPERPIFGQVRYMSSENTRRKLHVKRYLARYTPLRGTTPMA